MPELPGARRIRDQRSARATPRGDTAALSILEKSYAEISGEMDDQRDGELARAVYGQRSRNECGDGGRESQLYWLKRVGEVFEAAEALALPLRLSHPA